MQDGDVTEEALGSCMEALATRDLELFSTALENTMPDVALGDSGFTRPTG